MGEREGTVLVTAASKHGSTAEIARVIGETLAAYGIRVAIRAPGQVGSVEGYRACVLGSAVYGGRWRKDAAEFVLHNAAALRQRPVWLFSSGPVGDPLRPAQDPADAAALIEVTQPKEHRVFAGRLGQPELGFLERQAVRTKKISYGDFRDWEAVRAWATTIAESLQP